MLAVITTDYRYSMLVWSWDYIFSQARLKLFSELGMRFLIVLVCTSYPAGNELLASLIKIFLVNKIVFVLLDFTKWVGERQRNILQKETNIFCFPSLFHLK